MLAYVLFYVPLLPLLFQYVLFYLYLHSMFCCQLFCGGCELGTARNGCWRGSGLLRSQNTLNFLLLLFALKSLPRLTCWSLPAGAEEQCQSQQIYHMSTIGRDPSSEASKHYSHANHTNDANRLSNHLSTIV